jgi:hypothetical protein
MGLRDYGLPNPTKVIGRPSWKATDEECPNCGARLCFVSVDVEMPKLRGGRGVSRYLGCPACPFASPAMVVSDMAGSNVQSTEGSD